jgi:UDP-galactopyranose mutase
MKKKAVVVGGGFAGCTAAYMLKQKGFAVTLIEGSSCLGGGCRTFFYHGHPYTCGPHHLLINVNEMEVWVFFSQFLSLREIKHATLSYVSQDNKFYNYPIHWDDIDTMPDKDIIKNELKHRTIEGSAKNFEEYWINSVGQTLYDKFIDSYSKKMWQIPDNTKIDEFSFSPKGVPIKTGSKICFDGQKIIAYPKEADGYNSYFEQCTEGCTLLFETWITEFDLDKKRVKINDTWIEADILVSTASIDSLFGYCYGELPYIGREFLKIILPVEFVTPPGYYFIHYAGDEPYTRIFEYKLLTGYKSSDTLIVIETPSFKNKLYPYPIKKEIEKANKYLSELPSGVFSLGRAGKYHYDNMDVIVKDCWQLMDKI